MKRTSKILALLLTVALICGALVIASFAVTEDLTAKKATNFENKELTVGQSITASDGTNPSWNNLTFQQGGRTGKVELVEGSDGNKYAVITQTDKVGSGGPYAWSSIGARPAVKDGALNKGNDDISNYKFYKFEIDVMSPTGKFIAGNIDLSARYAKTGGTVDFWNTNATSNIVKFGSDNGGTYLQAGFDSANKKYVNPYEFTKLELIIENTSTSEALGLTTYAYVNGELWFTKVASNVPAGSYYNDELHASFIEYRVNYTTVNDPSQTLGIDNLAWSTVPAGSEATVADLVSYDATDRPAGLVVATVDGVDYNTLEGAIAAAAEGSTIDVLVDKYTPTTVSKNIILNAGTKILNIVPGDGYKAQSGRGIYKVVEGVTATGITTKKTDNFDALVGNTASVGNPSGTQVAWTISGRWGKVEKSTNYDSNNYLLYTATDKAGTQIPYFGTGYGGVGTTARPTVSNGTLKYAGSIEFNPYLVVDFDVASPTGAFTTSAVGTQTRFMKPDGSLDSSNHSPAFNTVTLGSDSAGSYITSGSEKKYVNPYDFTHVTIVYAGDMSTVSYGAYVYINGEYFASIAPQDNSSKAFYGNIPHLTWDEVRWSFSETKGEKTIAFDNVVTRIVTAESNTNLADVLARKNNLSGWDSTLYDPDFAPYGIPVAMIGEVGYTTIEAAIAAANDGDTIKLVKNVGTVEIDKEVTIDKNGYTIDVNLAEGFAALEETEGVIEVVDVIAFGSVEINFDDCACDEFCDYEYHPFWETIDAYAYTKYFDLIKPGLFDIYGDGKLYKMVGLEKVTFNESYEVESRVAIAADEIITLADIEAGVTINVVPVYEEAELAFEYVVDGETLYAEIGADLNDAISAADLDSTIKLHSDYASDAYYTIAQDVTIDLNGKTLNLTKEGTKNNGGSFRVNAAATLTITSSVAGGKIFCGATTSGADPLISTTGDGATIYIYGDDAEGNTTLSVYGSTIVQAWSSDANVYIYGGEYYRTRSDNGGFIQLQKNFDLVVEDALIYDPTGIMFFLPGRYADAADEITSTAVINNCVLVAATNVCANTFKEASITFNNCYIAGDLNASTVYSGETAGTVTLGEGNYLSGAVSDNVEFAEGLDLYDTALNSTFALNYNIYTVADGKFDASTFVVNAYDYNVLFNKIVAAEAPTLATVNWYAADGVTLLGTSYALPGTTATVPADLKTAGAAVEGWLSYVPNEWATDLLVPADVTEYSIVAKEGGAQTMIADVDLLFNIRLTTHFEYIMYIPEVAEGVEITAIDFRGPRLDRYNSLKGTAYTINGKTYHKVDAWPGIAEAATGSTFGITFTYGGETYSVSGKIDMAYYCDYILSYDDGDDIDTNDYSDRARILAANVANYVYKANIALGKAASKFEAMVQNNTSLIIAPTAEEIVLPDMTAMSEYVSGVQLGVVDYGPYFKFNLTDAGKALHAAGKISILKAGKQGNDTDCIKTNNTHIKNINEASLYVVDGEETVSLQFSIANYIALLEDTADAKTLDLLYALYGYAQADLIY